MKVRLLSLMSVVMVLSIKAYEQQVRKENNRKSETFSFSEDFILPNFSTSTKFISEIDSLTNVIAKYSTLKERQVGFTGETPKEYLTFQQMKTVGTEEELNHLLGHYSPIVRVYAFRALKAKQMEVNPEMEKILNQDNEKVMWLAGCLFRETTVAQLVSKRFLD